MGWPKKNEGFRLYFERKTKTYLLVEIPTPEEARERRLAYLGGTYNAVGEVLVENNPEHPCLATTNVHPMHLYKKCRRVEWRDMPDIWKRMLERWIDGEPRDYRGLWKTRKESA